MTCQHDLAERETVCADGMCPLCLAAESERLRAALQPFADLLDRKWQDKDASLATIEAGGEVSELQAIRLRDVMEARRALEQKP